MKHLEKIVRRLGLKRLRDEQSGVSIIEFALLLPILLVIVIGTIEVTRLVLFHQKVDNATSRVADLITRIEQDPVQCEGTGSLGWMYTNALARTLEPYSLVEGSTTLVVNSVRGQFRDVNNTSESIPVNQVVEWHWSRGNEPSRIANAAGVNLQGSDDADWPVEFQAAPAAGGMFNGDRVIAVEVFHFFAPLLDITPTLLPQVSEKMVYTRAFYRARFGNLGSLEAGC